MALIERGTLAMAKALIGRIADEVRDRVAGPPRGVERAERASEEPSVLEAPMARDVDSVSDAPSVPHAPSVPDAPRVLAAPSVAAAPSAIAAPTVLAAPSADTSARRADAPSEADVAPPVVASSAVMPSPELATALARCLAEPSFDGLAALSDASHLGLVWRAREEAVAATRQGASGAPALRVVLVRADGEAAVRVETLDLDAAAEGTRLLPRPGALLRAVASVGLRDGARFCSIAHATLV